MRTQEEIKAKLHEFGIEGTFGFELTYLVDYAERDIASPYISHSDRYFGWEPIEQNVEFILNEMREYMSFAWDKANNQRGISACRSMCHYYVWLWLLNDGFLDEHGNIREYEFYGKPHLKAICERYGFENEDDGIWEN